MHKCSKVNYVVTTETKLAVQSEIGGWRVALPLLLHTLLAMTKGHKVSEDLAWAVSATSLTLMKEVLRFVSKLNGVTIRIGKGG